MSSRLVVDLEGLGRLQAKALEYLPEWCRGYVAAAWERPDWGLLRWSFDGPLDVYYRCFEGSKVLRILEGRMGDFDQAKDKYEDILDELLSLPKSWEARPEDHLAERRLYEV